MSTYDDASLILIPSGVKDGKVYSAKPTNGGGDFTFTRASEATRLVDGVVTKVRTNSILQSNDFDTTWATYNTTLTSGQADKDGGTDAWLVTKSAASGRIGQASLSGTGVLSYSLYVKANASGWVLIMLMQAGTDPYAYFDVSTGAVGTTLAVADASIISVGDGWYRCTLSAEMAGLTSVRTYPAEADGDASGTTGSIFIQNAQLEQGLVSTPYIATTTVAVSEGPVANMPRLNSVAGGCKSLKLEPQRTNLLEQGEYYNAYYTRDGVSVTDNALTSPEGLQNASKLVEDSANSKHRIGKATFPSGTQRTLSVFAKAGERNYISLFENNAVGSDVKGAIFNLSNGTLSINNGPTYYSNPTIEPIGSSGWYRCSVTWTATSLSVPSFGVSADGLENTYQGDGSSGIYIYGAQLEAGSYPTSYIPTYGTAATRVADTCSKTGISSLIGQTEGTMFAEFEIDGDLNTTRLVLIVSSVVAADFVALFISGGLLYARMRATSGGDLIDITKSGFTNGVHKVAIGYAANDLTFYLDGVLVGQNTSASVAFDSPLSIINVGQNAAAINQLGDGVAQALLFKTRLTNAQLATLTTI